MKRQFTGLSLSIVALGLGLGLVMAQDQKPATKPSETKSASSAPAQSGAKGSDDLSAIRAIADSFLKAYHAENPAALGALFTENAEIV